MDMFGAILDKMGDDGLTEEQRVAAQRDKILEYLVVNRDVPERLAHELMSKMTDEQIMSQGKKVAETIETVSNAVRRNPELSGNLGPFTVKKLFQQANSLFQQANSLSELAESSFVAGILMARSDGTTPDLSFGTGFNSDGSSVNRQDLPHGHELAQDMAPRPPRK